MKFSPKYGKVNGRDVCLVPINAFTEFYHYITSSYLYKPNPDLYSCTSFEKDMNLIVELVNGDVSEEYIDEYVRSHPYPIDDGEGVYSLILTELLEEVNRYIQHLTGQTVIGYNSVVIGFDEKFLYIVDIGGTHYVPEKVLDTLRSKEDEYLFNYHARRFETNHC